ncbi:hypothetical protein MC885_012454 [Smutsia gigantea]|nr:hypothetical protein MC885_012454 [Smutsia gigantea]
MVTPSGSLGQGTFSSHLGTGSLGTLHGLQLQKGCSGPWKKPVFPGTSQSRNLVPRLGASSTHDIIREREREGCVPRGRAGSFRALGVKREGLARGPWAKDSGGTHGRVEALVSPLLPFGDSQAVPAQIPRPRPPLRPSAKY